MHKRIILVGPAAAGKDFLKKKFEKRGFELDVSYTTRSPREGEVSGVDYHFISEKEFIDKFYDMYEHVKHGEYLYGTGQYEWDHCDVFIMETDGINQISEEDRKSCFVIYLDTPDHERVKRMRLERRWEYTEILKRLEIDKEKFEDFKNFDIKITNPNF